MSYGIRPVRRGRYTIGPLSVRLADPFGFCQIVRTFAATARISVLPAIVPLRTGPPRRASGALGGESRQRGITTGGEQDVTTRPYRPGDDRRRVHWRTTARTGELSVRREEQPWQSRATVLLDTRAAAHSRGRTGRSPSSSPSRRPRPSRRPDQRRLRGAAGRRPRRRSSPNRDARRARRASRSWTRWPIVDRRTTTPPCCRSPPGSADWRGDPDSVIAPCSAQLTAGDVAAMVRAAARSARCLCVLVDVAGLGRAGRQPRPQSIAATATCSIAPAGRRSLAGPETPPGDAVAAS